MVIRVLEMDYQMTIEHSFHHWYYLHLKLHMCLTKFPFTKLVVLLELLKAA